MHDCTQAEMLAALLRADDVDLAIETGLMQFQPCPACAPAVAADVAAAQDQLRNAWAARDRYLRRSQRLAGRAQVRAARRAAATGTQTLPPAAAEVLARAKARAAKPSS